MARHLRAAFPGAIYHVTCRMVGDWRTEKAFLFKDDADHVRFLDRLCEREGKWHGSNCKLHSQGLVPIPEVDVGEGERALRRARSPSPALPLGAGFLG